jgi:GxxExxY protein
MVRRDDLLFKEEVYAIIGAAIEVHRELGSGLLEAVYQEALEFELTARQIPFVPRQALVIFYKHQQLRKEYEADLVWSVTIRLLLN